MKKSLIVLMVLVFQISHAAWFTSFEYAQKAALETNKFMIVDFWATWCGPCKEMDSNSWNDDKVNAVLQDYVQVKIDIDAERELANKYGINSIPNMFIMDANGVVLYSFSGYHNAAQLESELKKFDLNTEFLSAELLNFNKLKGYNSSIRLAQKYFDYSILVDKQIKWDILNIANLYLSEAKNGLSNKTDDYTEKKQKLELLGLYKIAYANNFSKLEKKLKEFNEKDINENNLNQYYFLKYLACKGLKSEEFPLLEEKLKSIEGFDYFIKKADLILSKNS